MASRTLETVLTGTNKLSPVLAQAAKDVAAFDAAVSDANKRAGSSAEAAAVQQTSASDRVVAANEKTRQSNDRAKLSAEQMAQAMGSVQQQLGKLSSTKFEAKMDTTDARMQLNELRAKLAEIAGSDPTARVIAETDQATARLRAVQADLNRIDGQTVNAKVDVNTDQSRQGMQTLMASAMALSPALLPIGAAAAAGIGVIGPLAIAGAGGLGVLALGFSGVADAVKLMGERQGATGEQLARINEELAKVNPSTLAFAGFINDEVLPAVKDLQESAAAGLLPGVQAAIENLMPLMPRISDFVGGLASEMGGLATEASQALTGPFWMQFFTMIEDNAGPILGNFVHTLENIGTGFAGIITAFMPMAREVGDGIEDLSGKFAAWGASLANSPDFKAFVDYVQENWPAVRDTIANVAEIIGKVVEAGAPIGAALLSGFEALSGVLSALPVPVVEALLAAFIGFKAAQAGLGIVDGFASAFGRMQTQVDGLPGKINGVAGALAATAAIAGIAKIAGDIEQVANAGGNARDTVDQLKASIENADGADAKFQASSLALDALKQKAADAQKVVDDYNDQNWFQKYVWHNPFGDTSDQIEAKKAAEVYGAAIDDLKGKQEGLDGATQAANAAVGAQGSVLQDMVDSASGQLDIYSQLLQDKQAKEDEAARATAAANGQSTSAVQQHVADVNVSLSEYAAALDADSAKHDAWREDIKKITERGGVEVGAAFTQMGIDGAALTDQMANATDEDFRRMADSMVKNAREGGARAAWEMSMATQMMTLASREGTKLTAAAIAEELGIGVADAARIASEYGITLAKGINPVLHATGHDRIAVLNGQKVPDFYVGGYTGDGGKYEPMGIVHGGEFVVTKEKTAKHLPLLEAIHNGELDNVPGYANGGKVGLIALGHRLQAMGARVAENPAFPPLDMAGHGKTSLHYTGDAIDVNTRAGTSALEQSELAPMAALARSLGFRTIFMAPGHYNHLHVDDGAVGGSMGSLASMPAVVLPQPPSTAPLNEPVSTGADAAMQYARDQAQAFVDASTTTITEPSPGAGGSGAIRDLGRSIAASMGWGGQFGAIDSVFTRESGWNPNAQNPTSSAYGIPQFLNATWAAYGGKTSDPAEQIRDGIQYMVDRYGSPNGANAFWNSHHWYDQGGVANGVGFMQKGTLEPERVLSPRQTAAFEQWMTSPAAMPGYSASGGSGASTTTVTVAAPNVTVILDGQEIKSIARVEAGQVIVEALTGATNRGGYNPG